MVCIIGSGLAVPSQTHLVSVAHGCHDLGNITICRSVVDLVDDLGGVVIHEI